MAEYAYGAYAKNSPTVLAENRGASARQTAFPLLLHWTAFWNSTPEAESAASMSLSQNINYVQNWLETVCPLCDCPGLPWEENWWNTNLVCRHHRPRMQIGGTRGITVSFDSTSPGLQALGMTRHSLHSGLRPITEAIIRRQRGDSQNLFLELDHRDAISAAEISDSEGSEAERFVESRMLVRAGFPRRDTRFNEPDTMAIAGAQVAAEPIDGPVAQRLCPNCGRPTGMGNRPMVCGRCRRTGMCMGCTNDGLFSDDPICYPCQFGFQDHLSSSAGSQSTSQQGESYTPD